MPSGICINFATPERNEKKMEMEIQNRKKSERNFHNEHVHNHLALSPWSIWSHATRRRVSRIIPIVLRPKRGCKIFIISCPLLGQMQCKAISRFSIFHFVSFHFFYSFPSFWQIFWRWLWCELPFPVEFGFAKSLWANDFGACSIGEFSVCLPFPVPRLAPPTSSAYPRGISFVFR